MAGSSDRDAAPLREVVARGNLSCTLEEAALVLARQEYPDLVLTPWIERLDAFAGLVSPLLSNHADAPEIVGVLNDVLFHDLQFRGNRRNYYDPRNSFLNDVLDRRVGIPITLSIAYMAVARRVGLQLNGTAFPGHFLMVHERVDWPIVIDAFERGRVLLREDCEQLLERADLKEWDNQYLEPVSDLAILRRMLNNLQSIYLGSRDWPRLLRTANQILVVTPEDHDEHFTRALALAGCKESTAAIAEFELYLQLRPESEHRETVLRFIADLRRQLKRDA